MEKRPKTQKLLRRCQNIESGGPDIHFHPLLAEFSSLVRGLRTKRYTLNPNLPVYDVRTMANRVTNAAARARFSAILLGIFAIIAIALAAIGIYGVMSYSVRQRNREIGIRVALGARSKDVVRHEVYVAAVLIFAGTVLGLAGALAATQVPGRQCHRPVERRPSSNRASGGTILGDPRCGPPCNARRAASRLHRNAKRAQLATDHRDFRPLSNSHARRPINSDFRRRPQSQPAAFIHRGPVALASLPSPVSRLTSSASASAT